MHRHPGRRLRRRMLLGLELVTGGTAVAGGVLLVIAPDGSLLGADPSALVGSPFADWRLPGVLLTTLVGGAGLVAFEVFELAWIGFQPLEAVVVAVGAAVLFLAATDRPTRSGRS